MMSNRFPLNPKEADRMLRQAAMAIAQLATQLRLPLPTEIPSRRW
jgi:hypothetical protein